MRSAAIIVGGVFSCLGFMFFAALEATTAAPIPTQLNPAASAERLEAGLVSVPHSDIVSRCLSPN